MAGIPRADPKHPNLALRLLGSETFLGIHFLPIDFVLSAANVDEHEFALIGRSYSRTNLLLIDCIA